MFLFENDFQAHTTTIRGVQYITFSFYSGNKDIFQKVGQLITDSVLLDKDEADYLSNPDMASDED